MPFNSSSRASDVIAADLGHICQQLETEFASISGKRLLISGGAGFLGYYLIQSVLHWNEIHPDQPPIRVTACDNYIRGVPEWLTALDGNPALTLLTHDITAPLPVEAGDFEYVIHAASIASPIYYRKFPIETMDANVNGLRLLLERFRAQQARGVKLDGFLFFSTSEIYGDPPADKIPTDETFRGYVSCTGPRACYDESKRFGETLCVNFAKQYNLQITIARPFNNYGPGLKITDRRVLPDFARDLFAGRDLVLLSDGSPTRTFCYIADAVVGYYKVLIRGRSGESYNVGNETPETSMYQLAQLLAAAAKETFGYEGTVVRQTSSDTEYLTDNPQRRCPSIAKARAELDFEPLVALDDGLTRTLVWYRDNQIAADA